MNHDDTIIENGAESIVVLSSDNNGKKSVTKHRRPHGKTQYKFEAYACEALRSLGAKVPRVISVSNDELVMMAFDGEIMDDQVSLYNDQTLFRLIAKDLALNRRLRFTGFGKAIANDSPGVYHGKYSSWIELLDITYAKLQRSTILSNAQKSALTSHWNSTISKIKFDTGLLVHGDFALSAIFVKDRKYEGIIDFGDAFIGDPLLDLAYFRFKEITKVYGRSIYDALLDNYLEFSGLDRTYVESAVKFYMIYWAVERIHTGNLDRALIDIFIEKTDVLISELS